MGLNASQPIIVEDRTMSAPFRDEMNRLDRLKPLTGAGSPEGVVEAPQFSVYLDTTGGAGSIEYRKMQTEIAGDRKKGWVGV